MKIGDDKEIDFKNIVTTYNRKVYYLIRGIVNDHDDANDLTQEVFIKIWNNLHSFNNKSSVYTWIYKIAVNTSLTFLKKKNKYIFEDIDGFHNQLYNSTESYLTGDDIAKKLNTVLNSLPNQQKIIFNLRYFNNLKHEEIAEILDLSVGGVKSTYHIAVKKIEEFLNNN